MHRTESVSVMGHQLTMGASSTTLVQKQQNIFGRISLFWSVALCKVTPRSRAEVSIIAFGVLVDSTSDTKTV